MADWRELFRTDAGMLMDVESPQMTFFTYIVSLVGNIWLIYLSTDTRTESQICPQRPPFPTLSPHSPQGYPHTYPQCAKRTVYVGVYVDTYVGGPI